MSGRFAAVLPQANTPTELYKAPTGKLISVTIRGCNKTSEKAIVSIQLCDGTPGDADYIEPEVSLSAKGVVEDAGIILSAGQSIIVTTSVHGVNFICWGIDENL